MVDVLTCPACHEVGEPAAAVATVAVCGTCGATVTADGERTAVHSDVEMFSDEQMQTLRKARGRIVRPTKRQPK